MKGGTMRIRNIYTEDQFVKNKQISAKVNKYTYEHFTEINKARGIPNNRVLNSLIEDYIGQWEYEMKKEGEKEKQDK